MDEDASASMPEMEQHHRQRVCQLLWDIGKGPGAAGPDLFLAAYKAVLEKDMLSAMSELLACNQREAAR